MTGIFQNKRYLVPFVIFLTGCATLFGWDIHAPGILSKDFSRQIQPLDQRIALYPEPSVYNYQSKERGGRLADPQTYHVGESFAPMLVEAFQSGFDEFVFLETEPTPEILKQYGIPYLAVVRVKDFGNRVTLKGQALAIETETVVFDSDLKEINRFHSTGSSDAKKVFSKKGGPEVNLNAALENNARAIVQYLQDSITTGNWKQNS
ncbi:MAG: hypothetical protein HYZ83_03325 [Candidatus Omnitrophica bacterium]|nr:hypothetical protein [Candidatus Omnitrophota bacterium]